MSQTSGNKPIHVLRRRGVKVSIFHNEANGQFFHKVAIHKIYRDDEGAWKTASALGRDDLPIARMLLGRAWEYILDQEAEPNSE